MDPTNLAIFTLRTASKARKRREQSLTAEDAYYAAHSGDWLDFLARSNHLTGSVERELRQMTTARGWARLF
jgi:hypothetical protein